MGHVRVHSRETTREEIEDDSDKRVMLYRE